MAPTTRRPATPRGERRSTREGNPSQNAASQQRQPALINQIVPPMSHGTIGGSRGCHVLVHTRHRAPRAVCDASLHWAAGLATLVAVLQHGAAGGGWFVAGLATYTIGRQGILHWRVERKSPRARLITAAIAAVILVVDLSLVAFGTI